MTMSSNPNKKANGALVMSTLALLVLRGTAMKSRPEINEGEDEYEEVATAFFC
jgi:hypothetical protein